MTEPQKTVSQIGEFNLIERIKKILPKTTNPDIVIGIGDDTAVIRLDDRRLLLVTCDIQVENRHFRRNIISPYQLGRRAMAVNLSDIAAMGGRPTFALVSLGLPKSLPVADYDHLIKGMSDELQKFSAFIVGGNLAATKDTLIIDITLLGEATRDHLVTRSGANPGDRIFVTGQLGASAAGFFVLEKFGKKYSKEYKLHVQAHLQPQPRVQIGEELARSGYCTAMIDISDGIAGDLYHICASSGTGAAILQEELPLTEVSGEILAFSQKLAMELALHGGEDYELLFTTKPEMPDSFIHGLSEKFNMPIAEIGTIIPKDQGYFLIDNEQNKISLQPKGWDHFSSY